MNLLPVVERELRIGARQTLTYALRVMAVAALLLAAGFYWLTVDVSRNIGGDLFHLMHCTLLAAIWVLVPMLGADCISRERREGTLALLFLTPLRPASIVLAKAMAQGLRAFSLWLAALPALTIPFIAGGVSWKEGLLSVMVSFSSLCLALAAGLVASARSRNAMRSLAAASILSLLFFLVFLTGMSLTMTLAAILARGRAPALDFLNLDWLITMSFPLVTDWDGFWAIELIKPLWWFWSVGAFAAVTALSFLGALWLVLRVTGKTVERVWREEPPSARVVWLQRKFTTPLFFRRSFHRWMRWELHRNPVGWLERRTWSARLVVWGWTAVVICVYSALLTTGYPALSSFYGIQHALAWLLVLNVAASAAGSFRRERETGVLELLLVTPLSEQQIIGGRLRGLWGKFFLPQALLTGLWLYCLAIWRYRDVPLLYAGTFATLPVIGLYYSLARKTFVAAFLWTIVMGVLLPAVLALLAVDSVRSLRETFPGPAMLPSHLPVVLTLLIQLPLAGAFLFILQHHLEHRKFAMQ